MLTSVLLEHLAFDIQELSHFLSTTLRWRICIVFALTTTGIKLFFLSIDFIFLFFFLIFLFYHFINALIVIFVLGLAGPLTGFFKHFLTFAK